MLSIVVFQNLWKGIIGCWPLVDYCLMKHCMETGKAFLSLLTLHHLEMQLTTGLSPQLRWQNCTFLYYLISLLFLLYFYILLFLLFGWFKTKIMVFGCQLLVGKTALFCIIWYPFYFYSTFTFYISYFLVGLKKNYVLWLLVDTVHHFAMQSALQLQTAKMHFLQSCWPVPAASTYLLNLTLLRNIFWSFYKCFPP